MGGLGIPEIAIIIAVLVLFFGAKKIPELARGIGEGMTEFKKATREELQEGKNEGSAKSEAKEPEKTAN